AESRLTRAAVSIDDPQAELARLNGAARAELTSLEVVRLAWLEALNVPGLGMLNTDNTVIESPRERHDELEEYWETAQVPKPLSWYDIPSQFVIVAAAGVWGAYLLQLFARVGRTSYAWSPEDRRLTLPNGATLVPSDLEDVDKRKWSKFIVFLPIKKSHDKLGGKEVRVDLFRHDYLEDWILEMERVAFPDRAEDDDDGEEEPVDADESSEPSVVAAHAEESDDAKPTA
ncbi:MAG: hypothetical protein AAF747_10250, partial [Planctomycetota bacterium]